MIRARRVRWCAVVFAALAAAGALRSQSTVSPSSVEKPAKAAPASAKDEPGPTIEVARREFEAVKSLRDFGADPKSGMPRLTMPSMPSGAGPTAPLPVEKKAGIERQASKNWLLDAMEKNASERGARTGLERNPEKDPVLNDSRQERARDSEDQDKKNRSQPPNPFSRFLGEWMTPQDLALLKPALESSTRVDGSSGKSANSALPGDPGPAGIDSTLRSALGTANGGSRPTGSVPARENPYLESLAGFRSPGTTPPVVGPARASPAVAPPTSPGILPPNPAPAQPARPGQVPDFVRPTTDEKYFKQLKRF